MTGEPLRVGVIGTRTGGRMHLTGLRRLPETRVVAVCGLDPERTAAIAAEEDIPNHYTDYRALIASDDVEAVSIATPPHLHHQMAVAALLAGKHVLCEQPMARTVAEARDMVRQAEAAQVAHMVCQVHRYLPARRQVRDLLAKGFIGELRSVTVTVIAERDPATEEDGWRGRADHAGGVLDTLGAPVLDTLQWWLGPVRGVTGRVTGGHRENGPPLLARSAVPEGDTAALLVEFACGGLGSIHLSTTSSHGGGQHFEIYGTEGTLVLTAGERLLAGRRSDGSLREVPVRRTSAPSLPADSHPWLGPYLALTGDFAAAARAREERSPSFRDGLQVQEIIGAVQKAAYDGQWATFGRPRMHQAS